MRGRKRHRKKRAKWDRRARARSLDEWFREGRIFIPSRLHLADEPGFAHLDGWGDLCDAFRLAVGTWERLRG